VKPNATDGQVGGLLHEPDDFRLMADQMPPGLTWGPLTACHRPGCRGGAS
jgi:hypothetical protein